MQSHDDMRLKHMLDSALNFHLTTPQVSFLVPCAFHLLPLTFHLSPESSIGKLIIIPILQ